jgi:hypothetical protein
MVGEVPRVVAHEERIASLNVDPHPSPCTTVAFPSLESFHPQRSSHPEDNTKLTQREASHFITIAIAAEEDGSEKKKKRRGWRKGLKTPCPLGPQFIAKGGVL